MIKKKQNSDEELESAIRQAELERLQAERDKFLAEKREKDLQSRRTEEILKLPRWRRPQNLQLLFGIGFVAFLITWVYEPIATKKQNLLNLENLASRIQNEIRVDSINQLLDSLSKISNDLAKNRDILDTINEAIIKQQNHIIIAEQARLNAERLQLRAWNELEKIQSRIISREQMNFIPEVLLPSFSMGCISKNPSEGLKPQETEGIRGSLNRLAQAPHQHTLFLDSIILLDDEISVKIHSKESFVAIMFELELELWIISNDIRNIDLEADESGIFRIEITFKLENNNKGYFNVKIDKNELYKQISAVYSINGSANIAFRLNGTGFFEDCGSSSFFSQIQVQKIEESK